MKLANLLDHEMIPQFTLVVRAYDSQMKQERLNIRHKRQTGEIQLIESMQIRNNYNPNKETILCLINLSHNL